MTTLSGKVALVTGGGRGIGRGCALALARGGADVALNYRRDAASARATAGEIEALGRRALAIEADVSDESQVAAMIETVQHELGGIDILIANAGIASRGLPVHDTTTDEMRRVLDTHILGTFWCARAVLAPMRSRGCGHIITISSIATRAAGPGTAPYTMAKAAIETLTRVLSQEEGPHGIRVNCIAPGLVETEMGNRLMKARAGKSLDDLRETFPFGRVCQPEDIGHLAVHLCSEAGSYISGQVIFIDGGGFQRQKVL